MLRKYLHQIIYIIILIVLFSCEGNIYDNGVDKEVVPCQIKVKTNGYGRVTPDKFIVDSGETFTIKAQASRGYIFKYWASGGRIVSINDIYNTQVYKDTEFEAYFQSEEVDAKAVDLGLSVKWAECNVGASLPHEYGDFFAWGETSPKSSIDYFWETYILCDGTYSSLNKYNSIAAFGRTDNRNIITKEDDAAYSVMGENWRLPSENEFKELYEKCQWEWSENKGTYGYNIKGPNGNTIFLPLTGCFVGIHHNLIGSGYYWSNMNSEISPNDAYALTFTQDNIEIKTVSRKNGLPIRAVWRE